MSWYKIASYDSKKKVFHLEDPVVLEFVKRYENKVDWNAIKPKTEEALQHYISTRLLNIKDMDKEVEKRLCSFHSLWDRIREDWGLEHLSADQAQDMWDDIQYDDVYIGNTSDSPVIDDVGKMIEGVNKDKKTTIKKWRYTLNQNFPNPAFQYLMLSAVLKTSDAKTEAPFYPPLDDKINTIYQNFSLGGKIGNITKTYRDAVTDYVQETFGFEGDRSEGWIKIPGGDASGTLERNQALLQILASDTGWCIAGAQMANTYLKSGDFYIYIQDGRPKVAVRTANNFGRYDSEMNGIEQVAEIQGLGNTCPKQYGPIINSLLSDLNLPLTHAAQKRVDNLSKYDDIQRRLEGGSDEDIEDVKDIILKRTENVNNLLTDEQMSDPRFTDTIIQHVQNSIIHNQYNTYGKNWPLEEVINMYIPKALHNKMDWKKIVVDATQERIKNQLRVDVGKTGNQIFPKAFDKAINIHPDYLTPELAKFIAEKLAIQTNLDPNISETELFEMMNFDENMISNPDFQRAWQKRVIETIAGRSYQGRVNEFIDKLIPNVSSTHYDKMFESKDTKEMFIKQLLMAVPDSPGTITYNRKTLPFVEEFIQKHKDDPVFIEKVMPNYYISTHSVTDSNSFQPFSADATAVAKKAWLQTLSTIFVPPQVINGQNLSYLVSVIKTIPANLIIDPDIRKRVFEILQPVSTEWLNSRTGQSVLEPSTLSPAHGQLIMEAISS